MYTYSGVVQTSATEAGGGVWYFSTPTASTFTLRRPGEASAYVSNTYTTIGGSADPEQRLAVTGQTFTAGQTYSYVWDEIENSSPESGTSVQIAGGKWIDADAKSVTVKFGKYRKYDPNNILNNTTLYSTPGPELVTDELGRVSEFDYCGSVALGAICFMPPLQWAKEPEGDIELFEYTSYRNVAKTTRVAKVGSGLPSLVETRAYGSTDPKTRAKPSSVTDAGGNTTTFKYDPARGGLIEEVGPAVGGVSPAKKHGYTQRNAWLKNGSGGYTASTPVFVKTEERSCRTSTLTMSTGACTAGAADLVITAYDYGPNSGPNNLWLRGVAVTSEGVTLRTCYLYDQWGDKISETEPKAGLGSCP
jgi:YD repeat-containing protein